MCTTWTRNKGQINAEPTLCLQEVLPFADRSDGGRFDLRLTVPTYGRVYLHALCYWLLKGRALKTYGGSWDAFRRSGMQVDHGLDGRPHMLDYRSLRLLPGSGPRSNAAQGAKLRSEYRNQGGLRNIALGSA